MELYAIILVFWLLSFKPVFSLSSFTLIKKLVSSSSLSVIRVVSSAYLRLLIFLPAVLIPVCDSFHMWNARLEETLNEAKLRDNLQNIKVIQDWETELE